MLNKQLQQTEGQIKIMSVSLESVNKELNLRRSQEEATKRFNDDSKYY
jgi:TolA-binding protein